MTLLNKLIFWFQVVVFQNKKKAFSQAVPYEPASVAVHPSSPVVGVCGAKVSKTLQYPL